MENFSMDEYMSTDFENFTNIYPPDFINITNETSNITVVETIEEAHWVYTKGVAIITIFCLISMIVNVRILVCIQWIQGPLSKTLFISLSLAAADAFTSAILCISLIFNSYLPIIWNVHISHCVLLTMEACRLGGIVTTVLHLMLLAFNHYLGIVRPLHYPNIMTHKLTTICLTLLWIIPPVFFLIYFSLHVGDGFWHKQCTAKFLKYFEFRIMFTLLLVVPLIAMTVIYTHILIIVRRKQKEWHCLAKRGASCRHRGGGRAHTVDPSRRRPYYHHHQNQLQQQPYHVSTEHHRNQQRMQKNVKAVHTTLLILGSYVGGLIPPITVFLLFCNNCTYKQGSESMFWFVNLLLVTKPLANPIIYAARMQEIKDATRRMRAAFCHGNGSCRFCLPLLPLCCLCCGFSKRSSNMSGGGGGIIGRRWARADSRTDSQQLYFSGSSWRVGTPRTAVCRLVSNGNTPHLTTTVGNNGAGNAVTFAETGLHTQNTINNDKSSTVL